MKAEKRPVLVVEDDPALGRVIQLVLTDAGYRVVTAGDGREALDRVEEEKPAVIVLDMKMPVMDGWEFSRHLRERYGREIPVIMLTAAWNSRDRAEEIGAEDYLDKPFDIDDLVQAVGRHYMT